MIELLELCDLRGHVVVIPSICVGNVGQLACDLLISTLKLKKLGYVWHPSVLTFSGADPYEDSINFCTSCEIFHSPALKLLVFQIRSAFRKNINIFLDDFCDWLKSNHVKQVIVLAGISAYKRDDQQLVGEPLRYVFCPITKYMETSNAKSRNWVELESKECLTDSSSCGVPSHIPGAGIAVRWFHKCVEEKIPCSILLEFCTDGNNAPDALKLANYLDEWLQLKQKQKINDWIIPVSWNLLFGCLPPAEIFN